MEFIIMKWNFSSYIGAAYQNPITRPFYQNPLKPKIKIPYGDFQIFKERQKTDFSKLENIFPSKFLKIKKKIIKNTLFKMNNFTNSEKRHRN